MFSAGIQKGRHNTVYTTLDSFQSVITQSSDQAPVLIHGSTNAEYLRFIGRTSI